MKKLIMVCALAASQLSHAAVSCTQTSNTITLLGRDGNGSIYAGVTDHSNQCGCSAFRFRPEDTKLGTGTDTDMALSILLSAKLSDKKVRIDIKDSNDCNTATQLYIQ